jgi:type IV pilus assembly protein PilC
MAITFRWTAKTRGGTIEQGEMSAETREEVITSLRNQGMTPTIVNEKKASASWFTLSTKRRQKIKDRDVIIFTRQFANMYNAGIPIVQALDILTKQTENKTLRQVVMEVKNDVESGMTLAEAMKKHPTSFDDLYVNLVAAGESGGVLDAVLQRLAVYIEKAMKLKRKVKGAMIYPALVMGVAVAVVTVIMIFVIPVFAKIFGSMGVELPLPTRIIIAISNFLGGIGGLIVLIVIIAVFFAFRAYKKTEKGRMEVDKLLLKLPVFGDLIRKTTVARFTRTLGTLISSGVPILDGLEICAKSAGNKVVEKVVYEVRREVTAGKTLAEPMGKYTVFPPMVVQMVSVGESTGSLDQMLSKIADFYDDEVDNAVANLTTMLEPIIMMFLGVVIGGIVIALYLPIFKLGAVVGG